MPVTGHSSFWECAFSPGYSGPSVMSSPIVISVAENLQKMPALAGRSYTGGFKWGRVYFPRPPIETRIKEKLQRIGLVYSILKI
ncbi:aldo-keto reductase family 4 member C10-like [Panicum miliaceum]|uniref:Aldo-keto reductase family 4 member C10-like n=1 Tax=Panicum miliaceum TaxID=4540 RepID=A0A3L6SX39_PANMI|nr:aldo-keto reductase family 4 member C10-like [Panicum miliaceum]